MDAANAYVNGAGSSTTSRRGDEGLEVLNALLAGATPHVAADKKPVPEDPELKKEQDAEPASKPGGFKNDPDDPTNPNEVRYRYIEKVDQEKNS